jgi:Winged helix DNA-binding domain
MDLTERLRAWTYQRLGLEQGARTLEQALRAVVAVYATHPTAPLALWARTPSFTPAKYRRLDRSAKAARLPAMRRTVFLVPSKNAARVFSAVQASPAHALRPLKRHGFTDKDYERYARRVLAAAEEPAPTRDLEAAVGLKGAELGTVLRCLRYEGRLLTLAGDSLNMSPHRYVATSSWLSDGLEADVDAARRWLAGEYLRAYGPARIQDFAWWTGLPKGAARKAVEEHDTIDVGDGLLLHAKDAENFERTGPLRSAVAVLPKWDAYTMAHAPDGRARFVHPDVQTDVYTPIGTGLAGDGNPVFLVDGEVAGLWTFSHKEGLDIRPFARLGGKTKRRVDERLDEAVALLT